MFEKGTKHFGGRLGPFNRAVDMNLKLLDVLGDEVGQVGVLGAVPDLLDGIELGGVGGQPFEGKGAAVALGQPAGGRAMDVASIPHDDEVPAQASPNRVQEVNDLPAIPTEPGDSGLRRWTGQAT